MVYLLLYSSVNKLEMQRELLQRFRKLSVMLNSSYLEQWETNKATEVYVLNNLNTSLFYFFVFVDRNERRLAKQIYKTYNDLIEHVLRKGQVKSIRKDKRVWGLKYLPISMENKREVTCLYVTKHIITAK